MSAGSVIASVPRASAVATGLGGPAAVSLSAVGKVLDSVEKTAERVSHF